MLTFSDRITPMDGLTFPRLASAKPSVQLPAVSTTRSMSDALTNTSSALRTSLPYRSCASIPDSQLCSAPRGTR